ncbi:MAG: membrane protein insertase YidC, partial [Boseongicola sp.]|nr:membrane protein insertase YidC [Boseongicola sp.]
MDDQNKNLILAMVLSTLVLVAWMIFFAPEPTDTPGSQPTDTSATGTTDSRASIPGAESGAEATAAAPQASTNASPEAARVPIETPNVQGSVSLAGGRIDQLSLHHYLVTQDPGAEEVT